MEEGSDASDWKSLGRKVRPGESCLGVAMLTFGRVWLAGRQAASPSEIAWPVPLEEAFRQLSVQSWQCYTE